MSCDMVSFSHRFPLNQAQKGVYYDCVMAPDSIQYNLPFLNKYSSRIDPHRLAEALRRVLRHCPALTSRLVLEDGEPRWETDTETCPLIVLQPSGEEGIKVFPDAFIRPFDILSGPLYRFAILYNNQATCLFYDIHHLLFDGRTSVLEFNSLLERAYLGQDLGPVDTAPASYALEETERGNDPLPEDEAYFESCLRDTAMTLLPACGGDFACRETATHTEYIPMADVKTLCREYNVSENSVFAFVLSYCLKVYCACDRVALAAMYHGRTTEEVRHSIGMFVKTLPFVETFDMQDSVIDNIRRTRSRLSLLWSHHRYPFYDLHRKYHTDLNVVYVFNRDFVPEYKLDGETGIIEYLTRSHVREPLSFTVFNTSDRYRIVVRYHRHLYGAKYIADFMHTFAVLMEGVVTRPADLLSALPWNTDAEQRSLLALSTGESLALDPENTFCRRFQLRVAQTPSKTAVVGVDGEMTYRQLDLASNAMARDFMSYVTPGAHVAVLLPRTRDFLTVVLAVFKAGAAYIPIDGEWPQGRVQHLLEDSGCHFLVTCSELLRRHVYLSQFAGLQCRLTDDYAGVENTDPVDVSQPQGGAYTIYTSGSTGKPKGVRVSHRALAAYLSAWEHAPFGMIARDHICCYPTFSFDASVDDLFGALWAGATLYVVPSAVRYDLSLLYRYLADHHITGGTFPTQLGMELLGRYDLPLRFVRLGGEKLMPVKNTKTLVVNGYGPTEFTVCACAHVFSPQKDTQTVPIGRPLPNVFACVVDSNGRLMPRFAVGELVLSGPQMSDGYWGNEALTAEKFVPNPYAAGTDYRRMYRSGDLVRWNRDGNLEYIGRLDHQVKVRGYRVDTGEIESAVMAYPGIQAVSVQVVQKASQPTLCLYYSAADTVEKTSLQRFLEHTLAAYMMPQSYVQVEHMPLTANGKIDATALPEPRWEYRAAYVAPRNATEQIMAGVMGRVLGVERVGIDDNFYELGGDSIKAIRVVSKLREQGVLFQVAQILEGKTIRFLAAHTLSCNQTDIPDQQPVTGQVPLTFIQKYFFDARLPNPAHFNQSVLLQVNGTLTVQALRERINRLFEHHDMLRAVYPSPGTQVVRAFDTLHTEMFYRFTQRTLSDEKDMEWVSNALEKQLDITQGPLAAVALYDLDGRQYVFFVLHHLVVDRVSWQILLEDLNARELPPKTHSFARWATAVEAYSHSYRAEQETNYWINVQQEILNIRNSVSLRKNCWQGRVTVSLDSRTTTDLIQHTAGAYHTQINDLLLAAFCLSVNKNLHQDRLTVDMEGHGRERVDGLLSVDRTVGWFTSVFPVCFSGLSQDPAAVLVRVKETLRRVPHNGFLYGILQYMSDAPLQRNLKSLFSFNYMGGPDREEPQLFSLAPISVPFEDIAPENVLGSPLALNLSVINHSLVTVLDYDTFFFDRQLVQDLANDFNAALTKLVDICMHLPQPVYTASDFGELEWSVDVFAKVEKKFRDRGCTIARIYPLAPMQEAMLYFKLSYPLSGNYHLQNLFHFKRAVNRTVFEQALALWAAHHSVLRTAIVYKEVPQYRQVVLIGRLPQCEFLDFSASADRESALEQLRLQDRLHVFDLEDDTLVRIKVIRHSEDEYDFMLSMHHIIVDGWCLPLLLKDFFDIYRSIERTGSCELRPPAATYEDFVRDLLRRDRRPALAYWKQLGEGVEGEVTIPPIEPASLSAEGDDKQLKYYEFTAPQTRMMENVCQTRSLTLNTLVETAWGLVLMRYNHLQDVTFGRVVSGRNARIPGIEEMAGLFINTIPVRMRCMEGDTVERLLASMQRQANESTLYDFVPLSESLPVGTVLVFENYYRGTGDVMSRFSDCRVYEQVNYNLGLSVSHNEVLSYNLAYNPKVYSEGEMEILSRVFSYAVQQLAVSADQRADRLNLLPPLVAKQVLAFSAGDPLPECAYDTYLDAFAAQVQRTPDALAVSDQYSSLTYAELWNRAQTLAACLVSFGVREGSFVVLLMPRQKEFVVAALAIMCAGAGYVPLDESYPSDRKMGIIADSGARVLVSTGYMIDALGEQLRYAGVMPVAIEEVTAGQSCQSVCSAGQPAYMIYTSGSTGIPKGVVISQRALLQMARVAAVSFGITAQSHVFCFNNLGFDGSVEDLFPPLLLGASAHILPSAVIQDASQLNKYIKQHNLTGGCFPTRFFSEFLAEYRPSLDYVIAAGEKLEKVPVSEARLYNGYGPTEYTVVATTYRIDPRRHGKSLPIGRPVPQAQALVLDVQGNLLPPGAVGQLCLSGPQTALGYWNRAQLTAEKFIPNPYAPDQRYDTLYLTGDYVKWNLEGNLEFVGREDHLVKIRGFRVETGEIEARLLEFNEVVSCAVTVREIAGKQYICAYYVSVADLDLDYVRSRLKESLPPFMIPQSFTRVKKLPYTSSGKLDKASLPAPVLVQNSKVKPAGEAEIRLYQLTADLLGHINFGVTDDLFENGLDSISIIRLISKAIDADMKLTVASVMRYRTVREIVRHAGGQKATWYSMPHAGKKIVLFVWGVSPIEEVSRALDRLKTHFAVLCTDRLMPAEQFEKEGIHVENTLQELYRMAEDMIDPRRIDIVMGHSLGGGLACLLAAKINATVGTTPQIGMLDTMRKNLPASVYPYPGKTFLFSAAHFTDRLRSNELPAETDPDKLARVRQMCWENVALWKQQIPAIEVITLEADHWSILSEEAMNQVIKILSQ